MVTHPSPPPHAAQDMVIADRLDQLVAEADGDAVTLFWVMDRLSERAFGLFLLILALPCCIPLLWGIPQIVALPLMFISVQICLGRRVPWLPQRLGNRTIATEGLASLSQRARPWLRRVEAISRPRLAALTRRPLDRLVGVALVICSASILLPIPTTNTVPGIAVVLVSVGLLQRDGVLVILGVVTGMAWIATLLFAGVTVVSLLRDML